MKIIYQNLSNWSNSKAIYTKVYYPQNEKEIKEIFKEFKNENKSFSIMGNGNTYGDSFLNSEGFTINTSLLDKIYKINLDKNFVDVSCGIKINKLINTLLSKKRIINNLPGSHNVTIGGCIASNVHGKDSFKFGIFGNNLISLRVLRSDGKILTLSKNSKDFISYVGGYGINGIILSAKIKIRKISSNNLMVSTHKFKNLKQLIDLFKHNEKASYYMGAWIDHFSSSPKGIFKCARWNGKDHNIKKIEEEYNLFSKFIIFFVYPVLRKFFVRRFFIKFLNKIFFYFSKKKNTFTSFKNFYYPQEKYMPKHSYLYDQGKINIQILIPKKYFLKHFDVISKLCKKYKFESWWLGIKKHRKTAFRHSFSSDGYDITLQWSKKYITNLRFKIFYSKLINYMSKNNIILYHSKDILLRKKDFIKFRQSKIFYRKIFNNSKVLNNLILKRLG